MKVTSLVLLRLFASVHRRLTLALVVGAVMAGLLMPAFTVATGALVGAVQSGRGVWLTLVATGAIFAALRLLGPGQELLAAALARRVDEALDQRMMMATAGPPGLAHLEDPAVLD